MEPGTAGGSDGTSTSGSIVGGGGKVRFENPFGISSEDVINAVDKVSYILCLCYLALLVILWMDFFPRDQLQYTNLTSIFLLF